MMLHMKKLIVTAFFILVAWAWSDGVVYSAAPTVVPKIKNDHGSRAVSRYSAGPFPAKSKQASAEHALLILTGIPTSAEASLIEETAGIEFVDVHSAATDWVIYRVFCRQSLANAAAILDKTCSVFCI